MKKISVLILALFMGYAMQAQTATDATPVKTKIAKDIHAQKPAAYACPKCFQISKGSGQCEKCKTEKIQLGTYYCPKCMKSTGEKPGNCPDCKAATVQMTRKYCAKMGGTPLRNDHKDMNQDHKNKATDNEKKG